MDPSDVLEVTKVITAARSAFNHLKARTKTVEDTAKLIELQDAFQTLREENMRLREELRQRDARAAARGAYERRQSGNAVVRLRVGTDGTNGPPCCRALRRIASHQCTSCKGTFDLGGASPDLLARSTPECATGPAAR